MEVLTDGRRRRTRREWMKIIERFNSTNLSTVEFCKEENISRSSLATWRRKLKKKRSQRAKSTKHAAFVELAPLPTESSPSSMNSEFELTFPGGITLRWKG